MKLDDRVAEIRVTALERGGVPVPNAYQGVSKARIAEVLQAIDRLHPDMVDGVFALLDDEHASWFGLQSGRYTISDGATTAHLACHVGILQRGRTKLDREGRDYWIKPLREIGAIEPVILANGEFLPGHPIAKSPNSAYRLTEGFKAILRAPPNHWRAQLTDWIAADRVRERLELQARLAAETAARIETKHADLINACVEHYVPRFLPDFRVLYVDAADGDRITEQQEQELADAGLTMELTDAMPDVLLCDANASRLWVIEAVTSDGEVDQHKVDQMRRFAQRNGKEDVGFTTAFLSWKALAARQGRHKNIAVGTYIWVLEDPSKHLRVD